jgi:hypothetical protein
VYEYAVQMLSECCANPKPDFTGSFGFCFWHSLFAG